MKRLYKLTAVLLAAAMTLGVTGFTALAAEDTLPEAKNGVIKLTGDVEISKFEETDNITYDLNGHTLTYTGGSVSPSEGTSLSFIDSSVRGSKRGGTLELTGVRSTQAAFNPKKNTTINARNINITCTGSAFYPQGDAAEVNITDCDVEAAVYCVATNANSADNYGVVITLTDSTFTSSSDDGDNTAVMINVDGELNISGCTLKADRQALLVRAGDATVRDTEIIVTGKFADRNKDNATKYQSGNWQSGNEVPMGAVIVGDTSTNAYDADATLTIEDCEITSKNEDVPAIFTDNDNSEDKKYDTQVTIKGEDTVVTGAILVAQDDDEKNDEEVDIKIENGKFTDETAKDFIDKDSVIAVDKNGEIVIMTEEDYLDSKKSHGSSYSLEEKKGGSKKPAKEEEPVVEPKEEEELIFVDVTKDDPNYDAIMTVYEKGWMAGIGDNVFAPNGTLTRGMAAKILWNKAGCPEPTGVAPFLDVTGDAWYAKAVAWAYEQGIILGYDAATFGPNDSLTMEQFEIMTAKANGEVAPVYTGMSPNATRGWVAGRIAL